MLTTTSVSAETNALHWLGRSLLLLVSAGAPLRADINYVTNGDFEMGAANGKLSPTNPSYPIYVFGAGGATNLAGWTVSPSSVNNGSSTPLSLLVTGNPPQVPESGKIRSGFRSFLERFHGRAARAHRNRSPASTQPDSYAAGGTIPPEFLRRHRAKRPLPGKSPAYGDSQRRVHTRSNRYHQ